jgi:hypothetical protein
MPAPATDGALPLNDATPDRLGLLLGAGPSRVAPATAGHLRLGFAGPACPERPEFERFVVRAFEREHDAVIRTFMPVLVGWRNRDHELCSVVGLRNAAAGELFLERYLDRPVHEAIGAASGREVRRERVVEIGNLAGGHCRAALRLVATLPSLLLALRFEWVVFTATRTVRGMLETLGAPLIELGPAAEACVTGGTDRWGRYYSNDPRVCAGWLPNAGEVPAFGGRSRGP